MATEYAVFKYDTGYASGIFIPQGVQVANGPEQAVKLLMGDREETDGAYLAVPSRNATIVQHGIFQPVPRSRTEAVDDKAARKMLMPPAPPRSPSEAITVGGGGSGSAEVLVADPDDLIQGGEES